MLRPPDISVSNYPIATKPLLGFEEQLYISTGQFTDLGMLVISPLALNSGTFSSSAPDLAALQGTPQELLLICESVGLTAPTAALRVQVIGTDSADQALSGVATFTPPNYARDRGFDVHQHRGVEVTQWQANVLAPNAKFKTITSVVTLAADAGYANGQFRLVGVPSVASYVKLGTKTGLDYDLKIQEPVAIQDGADMGAYIKPGVKPVGSITVSAKDPVSSDGLRRYNGQPVTGLIIEKKQDILTTQHIFLGGLILTAKPSGQEGSEAVTLSATGMYAAIGCVLAQ